MLLVFILLTENVGRGVILPSLVFEPSNFTPLMMTSLLLRILLLLLFCDTLFKVPFSLMLFTDSIKLLTEALDFTRLAELFGFLKPIDVESFFQEPEIEFNRPEFLEEFKFPLFSEVPIIKLLLEGLNFALINLELIKEELFLLTNYLICCLRTEAEEV